MAAVNGMWRGDLRPLADYLRAGHPLNYMVRRELVHAIEGDPAESLYTLRLVKNRKGVGDTLTPLRKAWRQHKIGRYVDEQLPSHNDDVEAAVAAAMHNFSVGRTTVMEARKVYKRWAANIAEQQKAWDEARSNKKRK